MIKQMYQIVPADQVFKLLRKVPMTIKDYIIVGTMWVLLTTWLGLYVYLLIIR